MFWQEKNGSIKVQQILIILIKTLLRQQKAIHIIVIKIPVQPLRDSINLL